MDTMTQKQQAILTVAEAYYDRAPFVQYDQRSMDRLLQLTPRRRKYLPPESSNSQYIHFLDCSGFLSAVYLTAFGYELPSDLTWIMVDQLEPRIFYYELTHQETVEEIRSIQTQLRQLLQPGDLITYDRGVGGGHIVMYLGDGMYTDCTVPDGQNNSYNYIERKNQLYERAIWRKNLDRMLPVEEDQLYVGRSLFNPKFRRFSVHRPLEILGDILPQTKIRMTKAKDLWCAVENSAPGCQQAYPGQTVEYTVIVRNLGEEERNVTVCFENPAGTSFAGEKTLQVNVKAGEECRLPFVVTVNPSNQAIQLDRPQVTVNDLQIYAHPILLGRPMDCAAWQTIQETVLAEMECGATALAAASAAYGKFDIALNPEEKPYCRTHFSFHDSPAGDVLSRRPQKPFEDLAVYGAFGGKCVITPEMTVTQGVRMTHITRADLLPGDVLLCLDDGVGNCTYSAFFDGECLHGRFEPDEENHIIRDEELDRFIDSLFGRYAFLLLRPWQGRK